MPATMNFLEAVRASKKRNRTFKKRNLSIPIRWKQWEKVFNKVRAVIFIKSPEGFFFVMLDESKKEGEEFLKFPGGHLERGEWPELALMREVREETGLSLKIQEKDFLGSVEKTNVKGNSVITGIYWKKIETPSIKEFADSINSDFCVIFLSNKKLAQLLKKGQLPSETKEILKIFVEKVL